MTPMDKEFNFDGLSVYVDATSQMYLDGCTVDYVETLEQSGFKFINPSVKTTCGCGSSFSGMKLTIQVKTISYYE